MKDRNAYFKNIRAKHECAYRIVERFTNAEEAYEFELQYGKKLKNQGMARACYVLGNYGRFIDSTVLAKMKPTQFKRFSKPWNHGLKMNEAYRKRCRENMLGTKQSEETKKKRSQKLMHHIVSDETRKKIANSRKKAIYVTNLDTGQTIRYDSINDFAAECGVTQSALSRVVKSGNLYRNKFIIKHVNPEDV